MISTINNGLRYITSSDGKCLINKEEYTLYKNRHQEKELDETGKGVMVRFIPMIYSTIILGINDSEENYIEIDRSEI